MEINKKNVVVFSPSFEGHRQNYCAFVSDWFLRSGFRVILAVGRTSDGRPASETPVIGGLERRWGELVLDLGNLGNTHTAYGGLVGTLREIEERFSPEWTFLPAGDEVRNSLAGLGGISGAKNIKRAGIFIQTAYFYPPDLSGYKVIQRPLLWLRWKRNEMKQDFYFRHKVWQSLGLNIAFSTNPDFFHKRRSCGFHYLPEIYRAWINDASKNMEHADQLCREYREFLARHPGKDIVLYYGGWAARRGYDKLLHLVAAESDTIFISCGRPTTDINFKYDVENLRLQLKRQSRIFEVELPFHSETDFDRLLFRSCNFVLLPYDGFYWLSGMIMHAAAFGKPVLVPSIGYMNSVVMRNGIGLAYKNNDFSDFNRKFQVIRKQFGKYFENTRRFAKLFSRKRIDEALTSALLR